MKNSSLHFNFVPGQNRRKLWLYTVHHALVLEILTEAMASDLSLRYAITEYASNDFQKQAMATIETRNLPVSMAVAKASFVAVTESAFELTQTIMSQSPSSCVSETQITRRVAFEIKILAAAKLELDQNREDNAKVGIALAATIPGLGGPGDGWTLGKDWTNGYMAWNLASSLMLNKPTSAITKTENTK